MSNANTSTKSPNNVRLDKDVLDAAIASAEKGEVADLSTHVNRLLRGVLNLPPKAAGNAGRSGSVGG